MSGLRKRKSGKKDYTQQAYQGIRRLFFLNEISPGQKISYGDLAKRLKMSPTPIIQALKRLEFQGLVRHEPNRGYYTEPISLKEISEIYEFRQQIETALLPKTIERLTDNKLARLKKALDRHLEAVIDISLKARLQNDMQFHLVLAGLSGCTVQVNTLNTLFDLLYLKYRGNMLFVSPMEKAGQAHVNLYEAIAQRQTARAVHILSEHIEHVKHHAVGSIKKIQQARSRLV
jgi:DNA-binding GntR family transcriptional regulator